MMPMDYLYEDYEGDVIDRSADFLADLLSLMGFDAEIHTEVLDNAAIFDIIGDDVEALSPKIDPQTVNALRYILKRTRFNLGTTLRYDVDVNSYRLSRVRELETVAETLSQKVSQGIERIQCFGLDNVDRRALHLLLSAHSELQTESQGYGNFRHLEVSQRQSS